MDAEVLRMMGVPTCGPKDVPDVSKCAGAHNTTDVKRARMYTSRRAARRGLPTGCLTAL